MKKIFKKLKPLLAMLLGLLAGCAIGFMATMYIDTIAVKSSSPARLLIVFGFALLAIYGAMFLQIIIHEAGHLVCGLLTGYSYASFRIASLMLVKDNGKIKLKRMSLAGTGGQCLMSPPDLIDGKMAYMLYNFGGAIFNIITAAIGMVALTFCKGVPYLPMFLALFNVLGILFAFMNGIPMTVGSVNNDGKNALDISKSKDAMRAFWIQMKIAEQTAKNVRIKDMPVEWFTLPTQIQMKNGIIATLSVFAENRLIDQHNFSEASTLLESLASEDNAIIGLHRSLLACDNIYCILISENNDKKIDHLLSKQQKQFMKQMKSFPTVIRTEYTIALLAEQDTKKADKLLIKFEKCAKTYPYQCDIKGERELIEIAKSKFITE